MELSAQTESLVNIINLIKICQERGAFSLDEASKLSESIKNFDKENEGKVSEEQQKKSVILFIESLNKAQKKGLLEMHESHLCWECFQNFIKK